MKNLNNKIHPLNWVELGKFFVDNWVLVSSFLINASIAIKWIEKKIKRRKLKKVLSITGKHCIAITDNHIGFTRNTPPSERINVPSLTIEQAQSVLFFKDLCDRVNKNLIFTGIYEHSVSPHIEPYSEFCIGSPLSNDLVDSYMSIFFGSNFVMLTDRLDLKRYNKQNLKCVVAHETKKGFICNKKKFFLQNSDSEYCILIKLNNKDTGVDKTIHMIFGFTRRGTLCGTIYLTKNYKKLYKIVKKEHYFIVAKCYYHTLEIDQNNIYNLTDLMFSEKSSISKKKPLLNK